MKKIELLAPAGDLERLKVTLLYGADAVYIGGPKLGLRANATNFTMEEIKEACQFAHAHHKKVYVTVNIVFHDEDRNELQTYLQNLVDCGIDAVIVSDIYVISYMHEHFPEVEIHLSTQASTTNVLAAKFYKSLGVCRVVLARELARADIEDITLNSGVDTEVFIHGAMCTCYSGRCALSNYVTNRDANRGGCAQVCRFAFVDGDHKFTMATKDLNMATYIKELIAMGVTSLKVEGRMRSLYYLATVISCYRQLIDAIYENRLDANLQSYIMQTLSKVANREVSSQYFDHEADETDQYYTGRQEISNQDYLGLVVGYDKGLQSLEIVERNYFKLGDQVEIFTPTGEIYNYIITKIYNTDNQEINVARHPEEHLKLPFDKPLPTYSMIRLLRRGD